jgi:hypothetical protein
VTDLLDTGPLDTGPLDTGPLDARPPDDAPGESARVSITPGEVWRKARVPLVIGVLLLLAALAHTVATGRIDANYLDPSSEGPPGSRAVAELLRDRGIDVREVRRPSGARDVTVVVPGPLLPADVVTEARDAADLVLIAPDEEQALETGTGVTPGDERDASLLQPRCTHPDAVAAGEALVGGMRFRAPDGAVECYARSFVEVTGDGRRVTFLGDAEFMTNDALDEDGNAALALRLLSRHPVVEWVYPAGIPTLPESEGESIEDLMPPWVGLVVAQAFVVALLVAFWRGRRLGPVVVEPLPVVVRAAETVEGRARLYHSARARGRAAEALRAGLRDRLVRTLGLAPDASRETLVAAVALRTRGRAAADVDALLYGPPPADDPTLVRLADELDSLYSEVRSL